MNSLAYDILAYLVNHGDAQDTVEGIAEWWLMRQRIEHYTSDIEEALGSLVDAGLILRQPSRDSRVVYQINRQRTEEVRQLLARQAGQQT